MDIVTVVGLAGISICGGLATLVLFIALATFGDIDDELEAKRISEHPPTEKNLNE